MITFRTWLRFGHIFRPSSLVYCTLDLTHTEHRYQFILIRDRMTRSRFYCVVRVEVRYTTEATININPALPKTRAARVRFTSAGFLM